MIEQIEVLPDGSSKIDIKDMLEKYEHYKWRAVFNKCLDKIGMGKTITFNGTDLFSLMYNYLYGEITEEQMNQEIYTKKSIHSLNDLVQVLINRGFKIVRKDIQLGPFNANYVVEAERV